MNGTDMILPGPENVVVFHVMVPVLSAIFGVGGILLGHLIAPIPTQPLGWKRNLSVIAAGMLTALAIVISTGQRPLVGLGWGIGIGFSGITVFQVIGSQVSEGVKTIIGAFVDHVASRISTGKEDKTP